MRRFERYRCICGLQANARDNTFVETMAGETVTSILFTLSGYCTKGMFDLRGTRHMACHKVQHIQQDERAVILGNAELEPFAGRRGRACTYLPAPTRTIDIDVQGSHPTLTTNF